MKYFKKIMLVASLGAAFSSSVMANSAVVNYTGSATTVTCLVTNPAVSVDFGNVVPATLAAAGATTEWKTFTMGLNSCPETVTAAHAAFSGTADSVDSTLYANTGDATNIAIELQDTDANSAANGVVLNKSIASGAAVYNMQARVKSAGSATTGSIAGVVNVDFTYE